jgi:hypothetical protein
LNPGAAGGTLKAKEGSTSTLFQGGEEPFEAGLEFIGDVE